MQKRENTVASPPIHTDRQRSTCMKNSQFSLKAYCTRKKQFSRPKNLRVPENHVAAHIGMRARFVVLQALCIFPN